MGTNVLSRDCAGVDRAGVIRAGVIRAGVDRAGVIRAGVIRAGVDRAGVDLVGEQLAAEFDGMVPADVVEQVIRTARSSLEGDVPDGALPELLHRLAKQRLVDLVTTGGVTHRSFVINHRGRAT